MDFQGSSLIVSVVVALAVIMAVQTTVICIVVVFMVCKQRGKRDIIQKTAMEGVHEMEDRLYEVVEGEVTGVTMKHHKREM